MSSSSMMQKASAGKRNLINMIQETLIVGILLDVSGSMQRSYEGIKGDIEKTWALSIFQVITDLIRYDLLTANLVFALAFGGAGNNVMFDILRSLDKLLSMGCNVAAGRPATAAHVEEFLSFLEKNGVRTIRRWVEKEVISKVVDDTTLLLALRELKSNEEFKNHFIHNVLPPEARNWISDPEEKESFGANIANFAKSVVAAAVTTFRKASEKQIADIVKTARPQLLEQAGSKSVLTVQEAIRILYGGIRSNELTIERSKILYESVKPFIFGNTPLRKTLEKSIELFSIQNDGMKKVLFVLSDGRPTDGTDIKDIERRLKEQNVIVICCFISKQALKPKTLYSKMSPSWPDGAKILFRLSSSITTQQLPCAILNKRGWTIEFSNNETRLFMQVNHPENIREACDLARSVVHNQDALADLLATVSLDLYINQNNDETTASEQEGATCYANACATVLHLSMKQILGRDGGYPDFEKLRKEMIRRFGEQGADPRVVLESMCEKYRLKFKKVSVEGAKAAITKKRPVVAMYRLNKNQWKNFRRFYEENPTGILTKKDIDISFRYRDEDSSGHAVVLTSFNKQCLRLMNSWGEEWGDMGFFKVKSADVLDMTFIDVYWLEDNLTPQEKEYFKQHGSTVANKLMQKFIGLQSQTYRCPECGKNSLVTDFIHLGTLDSMMCPKCIRLFSCNNAGNILAMNMYLMSLSR